MNGIEKQAAFYRGYLIDDRSLAPLTAALATIVSLWLLVYLMRSGRRTAGERAHGRTRGHESSLASQSP